MSGFRFLLFIFLALALLAGINAQVFRWARYAFKLTPRAARWLKLALCLSVGGVVVGRVASRLWPGPVASFVSGWASTTQLAVIISAVLLLPGDGVRLLVDLSRWLSARIGRPQRGPRAALPSPSDTVPLAPQTLLPRRTFLTQAGVGSAFLVGGTSSLYGAIKGRYDYRLEEVAFSVPGLPRQLDGFSIAQLSDVHVGVYVGEAELAVAEQLLRRARPDLIVLTGDLLDSDPRLADQLGRFVRRLSPLARAGVVAISGNHDYFAGVEAVTQAITSAGALMLRNEAVVIGDAAAGFALLGVDDVWARREGGGPDLERAVRSLPRLNGKVATALDMPRILLCHNPSFFAEAAGRVALQLSGHTHGGQVNLGVRPADFLLPGGWVSGRYTDRGSALYVNRGFGTVGPPARVGSPPEVTRIVLTA